MSRTGWVNLALAASFIFYLIQVALDLIWKNTCGHLGTDFCAFWSAGGIANALGYAKVYDLHILAAAQQQNFPAFGDISTFAVSPIAYLPVFVIPFQMLALIPPATSFWIWTVINAAAFVLYLRFFYQQTNLQTMPWRLLSMLALSLPVYWNFLDGQVNVWLMICVGEFMRLAMAGKSLRAGMWLGGLLLKPQTLVLLGLVLMLQRSMKIMLGLFAVSTVLIGGSVALVGRAGIGSMLRVWLGFAQGMPTNDVDSMMNWRMLGFHLTNWLSPEVGWIVIVGGSAVTALAALYLWRRPIAWNSMAASGALLGTLAATCLVAWHSHIHMAMVLIPAFLLMRPQLEFSRPGLLERWVLVPTAAYFLVYVLASLAKIDILPGGITTSINIVRGGAEFAMNAWLLIVALQLVRKFRELQQGL
jgi:hypothetical protein